MKKWMKERPLLIVLVIVLMVISVVSIKPEFYLMGWDNYSSFFNLKTNFFRTLFATWRGYRGLGVPSDAEVTDVFRIVFYWIIHFLVKEELLDQIYYLLALWFGVVGMYFLARKLFWEVNKKYLDLAGFVAAFLYLFNLNTLSVFYSPLIPFTNRFFGLPLTLITLLNLKEERNKKNAALFVLAVLFASGSYITPTVLITNVVALLIFGLARLNIKQTVIYGLLFLALNAFWILPFVNFTKEKSAIVPLARTFVEINESTLNRPADVFSLEKQVEMYPSFLDMSFPAISGKTAAIHPLLPDYQKTSGRIILLIFPVLYLLGSILIVVNFRKNKGWWWVPAWIVVFLFLSTKEFGIFGSAYGWLKVHIPYFAVIFRISDTKFHAYINLAGSLAGAYFLIKLLSVKLNYLVKKTFLIILIIAALGYGWFFRSYFTGNLVGFFAYNKLPTAYKDIAKIINKDKDFGRVLHVSTSLDYQYWRSFEWGYLGSAFFDFMIDKPYIDKTFEPGSMENAHVDSKITQLVDNYYGTLDVDQKKVQMENWMRFLRRTGIEYIMVDRSIAPQIYSRNMFFSTKDYGIRVESIMAQMQKEGGAKLVGTFPINYEELYPDYKKLYPIKEVGLPQNLPKESSISLYKIKGAAEPVSFAVDAVQLDPKLDNMLETNVIDSEKTIIQRSDEPGVLVPLENQKHQASVEPNSVSLNYSGVADSNYKINAGDDNGNYIIGVYGKLIKTNLELAFYHRYYPNINGKEFRQFIGNVLLPIKSGGDVRLDINDMITALPTLNPNEEKLINNFMIEGKKVEVSILEKKTDEVLGMNDFGLASPQVCFGPQLDGYQATAKVTSLGLVAESKRGAICVHNILMKPKGDYLEYQVSARATVEETEENNRSVVAKVLETKGEAVKRGYICIKQTGERDSCLNSYRNVRLYDNERQYRVPISNLLAGTAPIIIQVGSVPMGNDKQTMIIGNQAKVSWYQQQKVKELTFEPSYPEQNIQISNKFNIGWPETISKYSYLYQPNDMFLTPQEDCKGGGTRIQRIINGTWFNEMKMCSIYAALPFIYSSNSPYLLTYDYWVGSGQQPYLVMGRNGSDYLTERLSLYQGYPNLKEMGQFEDPQSKLTEKQVNETLKKIVTTQGSRLLSAQINLNGTIREATAHIFQDTDNEGVLAVKSFNLIDYPGAWEKLTLTPENTIKIYDIPKILSVKQYLPSLWRVDYQGTGGKGLLILNQGYDRQWKLIGKTAATAKCNGFADCFEIATNKAKESVWLFYWPEALAILGWILTLTTAGGLIWWRRSKKAAAK